MKHSLVVDEMFPDGPGPFMDLEMPGGSNRLFVDVSFDDKAVHADFFNGMIFIKFKHIICITKAIMFYRVFSFSRKRNITFKLLFNSISEP